MAGRILIVKPSSLGDVLHAFPAVTFLAEHLPGTAFDWLVAPQFAEIVRYHPAVDRVLFFRRKQLGKALSFPKEFGILVRELRRNRYDAVIDFQGLLRSAAVSRLARAAVTAGPEHPRESAAAIFYKRKLSQGGENTHAVRRNLAMAADFLGIPPPEEPVFQMPAADDSFRKVALLVRKIAEGKIAAIAPGARWPSKQWPASFFAEAANFVAQRHSDCAFLILGAKSEKQCGAELAAAIHAPTVNLTGMTSTSELVEAIRQSGALLCNDSGPMHIAAALGRPLISFFGPTDPVLTGPFSRNAVVMRPNDLTCLNCFRFECPDPVCHRSIDPAETGRVLEKILYPE